MTNNWHDIGNSSCVLVWGANPAENHPACMAHINVARAAGAKLVVVDPRKTRTALQADQYYRIRPGTDIALQNGIVREIIAQMEMNQGAVAGSPERLLADDFFTYLNQSGTGTFYNDGSATATGTVVEEAVTLSGATSVMLANHTVSAVTVTLTDVGRTVFDAANYTLTAAAGTIVLTAAGQAAYPAGVDLFVSYTYDADVCKTLSVPGASKYTDARFVVAADGSDYDRETAYAGTNRAMSNYPKRVADCRAAVSGNTFTVYERLKAHVAPYTADVVADICDISEGAIGELAGYFMQHSRMASVADVIPDPATNPTGTQDPSVGVSGGYRALTILYAMGITQHTCGAANIKGFANLQTLMGNMGRCGGGINALRGIHNVQGSTDMGLLYGNIPAYSGNPATQVTGVPDADNRFGKYMNNLWGNPLTGKTTRTTMDGSYDDAYVKGAGNLQQRGFMNMTEQFFGDGRAILDATAVTSITRTQGDGWFSLWPKGNGKNHIQMYRDMVSGATKAAVVWGMNPAVTEPNQGKVREGLRNLDLLVVVDMFETETAACDRKNGGVTYLIPAAAHTEKAGSVTNSSRTLQWRMQSTLPKGNSKDDLELMMRFAYQLDAAGAFGHIAAVSGAGVYARLFSGLYGGFDGVTQGHYDSRGGTTQMATMRAFKDSVNSYPDTAVTGSEWVAEQVYREMALPSAAGGTIWIYTGAYNESATYTTDNKAPLQSAWQVKNRAKSRNNADDGLIKAYHGWGFSWLVNRRVLYNNGDVGGFNGVSNYIAADVTDYYMGPDSCSRLFVSTQFGSTALNYSRWYRTIHLLKDTPRVSGDGIPANHTASLATSGRFPSFTEPYETPREDLLATWGKNSTSDAAINIGGANTYENLIQTDTDIGTVATYPLVLTTVRCVEHFQGGPITRNNWWNVAAEPEPWIEINSASAYYGDGTRIMDGDYVRVITARNDGFAGDSIESQFPAALQGDGFVARVGTGLSRNQRVAQGVVAIPWHWGDRGLSTGSRANDLCIDAFDANTTIPEYKACLCRLEKML